jgi:uncharacterized protein (TIGR00299 family) protein
MTRALLIDPFAGAGGDMLLSALIDAGCPFDELRRILLSVPALGGVSLQMESVVSGPFAAKRLRVAAPDVQPHRGLAAIRGIIQEVPSIGVGARSRAVEAFTRLAETEARIHGVGVEDVHFHEVGALDAIVDVVGFFAAAELLAVDTFRYTRLVLGSGTAQSLHGEIPVPAPATFELLKGHPVTLSDRGEELLTPTAAAIIATVFKCMRDDERFVPEEFGYGAGTREHSGRANILRVALGSIEVAPAQVSIVRTTIDDMNPEAYGYVMERLFAEGALEVYYHAVMMKKNRPGVEVTVVAEPKDEQRIARFLLSHTTTLGVRVSREDRIELPRRVDSVQTELGEAKVKVAVLPGGGERMSPEFESCRMLAEKHRLPIGDVFDAVRRAWNRGGK